MTEITVQDGKVVLRDGKVGTQAACCCGGACDCCGEDYLFAREVDDVEPGVSGTDSRQSIIQEAGPGDLDGWLSLVGASRKEDAQERNCLSFARVYSVARSNGIPDLGPCIAEVRYRIYVPDCETGELIDITSDYEQPNEIPETNPYGQDGFVSIGEWEWRLGDSEDCPDNPLPGWPRDPTCAQVCNCSMCSVTVSVEIESETIDVGQNDEWSSPVTLCYDAGGVGVSYSERTARVKARCQYSRILVDVEVAARTQNGAFGLCGPTRTYSYVFEDCDEAGCPTGSATLTVTVDGNTPCFGAGANSSCFTITPPTSVTASVFP